MTSRILQVSTLVFSLAVAWANGAPYYDYEYSYPEYLKHHYADYQYSWGRHSPREVRGWGMMMSHYQVSDVAVDCDGNPVVFHRGDRTWNAYTFNSSYNIQYKNPISEPTIMTLNETTGKVASSWGENMFYLPHGLTIDSRLNVWITDVGLHQVMKFPPKSKTASMTLGIKLEPGHDSKHFCQPSAVAVSTAGEIYVADGYCNARVMHFNPEGSLRKEFGHYGDAHHTTTLNTPHDLALHESTDTLCVADRQNARIVCFKAGISNYREFGKDVVIVNEPHRLPVFGIVFVGDYGLVGVAGGEAAGAAIGFSVNLKQKLITDTWEPIQGFSNPHGICVDEKRGTIYVSETGPNRIWKFLMNNKTE